MSAGSGTGSLLGVSVLELRTDNRQLDAGLASARRTADREGAAMQTSLDKRMTSMGKSMQRTGSTMTRYVSAPIIGVGLAAADAAQKFQQAMEMIHTQAGAPQKEVDALRSKVLALAKTLPQSPQQLAEGLFHLESIGLRGAKAMDALKIAAQGAAVGNASLEDTATALGSAWLVNIKGAGSLQNVMGVLNATVGAGNMRMGDLVEALGTGVLPAAKLAGLSLEDVSGAIAVLSDEGTGASRAANLLRTSFHFLTDPTSKAATALQTVGLSSTSLAEDMHKPHGLLVALRDLKTHLDDTFPASGGRPLSIDQQRAAVDKYKASLQQAGVTGKSLSNQIATYKQQINNMGSAAVAQEQVLGNLFPAGRGWVLQTLLNQLDRYSNKLGQVHTTTKNYSQDVTATQQTAAWKIHQAWSQIQADAIQFGDKVLPALLKDGETVVSDVTKVAMAFTSLPKSAQDAIITGGLITAGIGPGMKLLGLFTSGVGTLYKIEQGAQKLATGQRSLFANPARTAASAVSGRTEVATMEVGELIVRSMLGGAGASGSRWNLPGTSTHESAPKESLGAGVVPVVEGGAAAEASVLGRAGGVLSSTVGAVGMAAIAAPLALGVYEALKKLLQQDSYGQKQANKIFQGGFGGAQAPSLDKQLAKVIDEFGKITHPARTVTVSAGRAGVVTERITPLIDWSKLSPAQQQKAMALAKQGGTLVAKQLEAGWDQYKFQSEPIMFAQLRSRLKDLRPQFQAAAVQSAVGFSRKLEDEGRLAKGSTNFMLKQIEGEFPGFTRYLGISASASMQTFTKALDFTQTEGQVTRQLRKVGDDFSIVQEAVGNTTGDMQKKIGTAVGVLKTLANGTGKAAQQARGDLHQLRASAIADLDAMAAKTASASADMKNAIAKGSLSAYQVGATNFQAFSKQVEEAMSAGTIAVPKGMQIITAALNGVLKSLGEKQLSITTVKGLTPAQLSAVASGQVSSGAAASRHAQGGLIQVGRPGQAGRDSVPLNVGGTPIVVAPGEQLAVFNRHQLPIVNSALAGVGGLPGLFSKVNRPHYMASGGFVPDPGANFTVGQEPQIASRLAALAEALGVTIYGISGYRSPEHSVAVGGFADDPHTRGQAADIGVNSQLRSSAAQISRTQLTRFGLDRPFDESDDPNNSEVNHIQLLAGAAAAGVISAGTAAAAIQKLASPKVSGTGTIAKITRAAVKSATTAANQFLSKNAPTAGGGLVSSAGVAPGSWLQVARQLAARFGWDASQIQAWQGVESVEDGSYSLTATNPGSGAYGLAQFINGPGEYAQYGGNATTLVGQLTAMANYIHGRYGTPAGALAHERAYNWYAKGGVVDLLRRYASGGFVVKGPASTFGPPGEAGGSTAYGGSDDRPGLAINPHGGNSWNDSLAVSLRGKWFDVALDGRTGRFQVIDKGPSAVGRRGPRLIDFTGRAAEQMGFHVGPGGSGFPTDDIATATEAGTGSKPASPPSTSRKAALKKAKQQAKARKSRPIPQPRLKALSAFTGMDALDALDALVGEYQGQQGYLTSLNGAGASLEPLVTLADGTTEVINWGSLAGPSPSGMIDPSTGQVTKGIYDRLREIGDPGPPATRDQNTELGIEETIVDTWLREAILAGKTTGSLAAYTGQMQGKVNLETKQVAWLKQALDETQPQPLAKLASEFGDLGSTIVSRIPGYGSALGGRFRYWDPATSTWQRYSTVILDKVREYRNAQALIDRWTTLKGQIPGDRTARDAKITSAFDTQRHDIQTSSTRQTFTAAELRDQAIAVLAKQKQDALGALPAPPPKGWKGDRTTWDAQHARERDQIIAEFTQREEAIRDQTSKGSLTERLDHSNALFKLTEQERAEKLAVSQFFDAQTKRYKDDIAGRKTAKTDDKTWLGNLRTAISGQLTNAKSDLGDAVTDGTRLSQNYTDTYSPLALNIKTAQTVSSEPNIPGYLAEIANLKGTVVPAADTTASGDTSSQLADLSNQLVEQLGERLAVSQAQYGVLADLVGKLPPFGGSFGRGGVVPGAVGEARTIIAHGGEVVVPVDGGGAAQPAEVHVHFHGKAQELQKFMDLRIEHKTRQPLARNPLPSGRGRLYNGSSRASGPRRTGP